MSIIYQEDENDSFTHNGKKYNLNALLRLTHLRNITFLKINKLVWILKHTQYINDKSEVICTSCRKGPSHWHEERVSDADITKPILVINDNSRWVIVDGVHRLEKAIKENVAELPVIVVTDEDLDKVIR
jgi:hypothetical protein